MPQSQAKEFTFFDTKEFFDVVIQSDSAETNKGKEEDGDLWDDGIDIGNYDSQVLEYWKNSRKNKRNHRNQEHATPNWDTDFVAMELVKDFGPLTKSVSGDLKLALKFEPIQRINKRHNQSTSQTERKDEET